MISLTHFSLAKNFRDIKVKHVHSEKHSDVNRRVVAVFKVVVFDIADRDCLKLYAVLYIIHPRIRRPIFIETYVHLGSAIICRKISTRNGCTLHQRLTHRIYYIYIYNFTWLGRSVLSQYLNCIVSCHSGGKYCRSLNSFVINTLENLYINSQCLHQLGTAGCLREPRPCCNKIIYLYIQYIKTPVV